MLSLLIFFLILTIVVLIHEAGHYFTAKKFGIKIEEFGFGLPPRAFGIKRGETIYSINWLPIGGFVKLYGEDEAGAGKVSLTTKDKEQKTKNKDIERAFFAKSVWQRAAVVVAGVAMNALLAIVIFYAFLALSNFKTDLPALTNYTFFGANQQKIAQVIVGEVAKNSPAEKMGIKAPSEVIAINGKKITSAKELTEVINSNKGKEISFTWKDLRTNEVKTQKTTPRLSPPKNEGALGVALGAIGKYVVTYETPIQKLFSGVTHPINLLIYNFDVMGKLISEALRTKSTAPISGNVTGPIGIYSVVDVIVQIPSFKERVLQILNLAGILSISLAFFNVLPIPALDGGRLFFILIEGFTGKKVNPKIEGYIHMIGMAILLSLIALVAFNDLARIFSGGFFGK